MKHEIVKVESDISQETEGDKNRVRVSRNAYNTVSRKCYSNLKYKDMPQQAGDSRVFLKSSKYKNLLH